MAPVAANTVTASGTAVGRPTRRLLPLSATTSTEPLASFIGHELQRLLDEIERVVGVVCLESKPSGEISQAAAAVFGVDPGLKGSEGVAERCCEQDDLQFEPLTASYDPVTDLEPDFGDGEASPDGVVECGQRTSSTSFRQRR